MRSQLHSMLRSTLVSTLALLATAACAQTTINVGPGQTYTTIQSGINAANNGDTVLVAPGTYNENIDFKGKAITVTSSGGAAATIIDGGNKPGVATVIFSNGETNASVISGFTIRGGGDTIFSGTSDGGVYISYASPTIQGNTITANYCHNIDVEFSAATIVDNEVSGVLQGTIGTGPDETYCTFNSGIFLGGAGNSSTLSGSVVIGNTIEKNLTGSGLNLWAAQNALILNNTIRNNLSSDPGSAFTSANSYNTVLAQNLIYGNIDSCGGALQFENGGYLASDPVVLIANNTIVDNTMTSTLYGASNCIDIAQIYPAAYSYGSSGPGVLIVNNIISGSTSYPAVNCSWFDSPPSLAYQPTFENNILYNAGGPFFGSYCVDVSNQDGNIAAAPQFVNAAAGNYQLQSSSPAIDTGQNSVLQTFQTMSGQIWTTDFAGKQRVQDATGKGCIIDMGAYEYPGAQNNCGVAETFISSLNPALAGQSVTFTAQLSALIGTPTGSVQFFDGATLLSTQTVSTTGSAAFTTSSLAIGSHSMSANYVPTGTFSAASASLTQVINGDPTATVLTCIPSTINIDAIAQLTATVTSSSGTPTGSITFSDDGATLATNNLVSGATSLSYAATAAGTHTITATYTPTGSFAASSATCSEVVTALPTTSVLTVTPATSTYGSSVSLTATVTPTALPAPGTPTGVVTFYNGSAAVGMGTLAAGVATLPINSLGAGSYNLTCMYGGSTIFASSNCSPIPVAVHPAPTALTLTSSNNPAPYLSPVTFTAHLTVNGQPAGAGNTILLSIAGQMVTVSTDANGSASYIAATLPAGSDPVTANFTATNNLLASAASLTQVVKALSTTTTLAATPNPGDLNQSVTLTATVTATSTPASGGNLTFYDGATALGSSPLSTAGTASFTASFTTLGVHSLTAAYSGNADFLSSTSAVFAETIDAGDFAITATPATAGFYTGQSAAFQVSVSSLQGFNQLLNLTCSGLPANATCSVTPASLPQGQGTAKLVIQTAAPAESTTSSISVLGALLLLLLPAMQLPDRKHGREFRSSLVLRIWVFLLVLGIGLGMSGCGSPTPITGGTPPGTYQVAVTATTAGSATPLAHSAMVTITVKSLF